MSTIKSSVSAPLVSVIVAVRNGADFLGRAIESILTQTMADLELVVVDDGSTDDTPDLLAACTARDTRVRAFRQEQQGGYAAANLGIAESRAELIARLDADDMALPDRLEKQAAWLDANPRVAVLGGWMISIDTDDHKLRLHTYPTDPRSVRETLRRGPALAHPTVMMRKSIFLRLGGYRQKLELAEDYDLFLRLSESADLANLPDVLTYYRLHPGQVTARRSAKQARLAEFSRLLAQRRRQGQPDPIDQGLGIDAAMRLVGLAPEPAEKGRPPAR